nr:hypothetical protein [Tanacetum cinerariifolium]
EEIHHFLVEVNLRADTASTNGLVCLYSEKDVSNDLNLSSKRNDELNVRKFSRIMLGIVGGGIGASPDVVIVAIVEGVIIGVEFHESSSSESLDGTFGTPGFEPVPSSVSKPLGVIALEGCFPLAVANSLGADSTVVVGVGVGGVVEEAESPFFCCN